MKTETKHTKGEWIVYSHHSCAYPGIEALGDVNSSIVVFGDGLEGVQGLNTEEVMANAKLIAAAPDLLDACMELLETYRQAVIYDCINQGHTEETATAYADSIDLFKRAKAAIDKATK